MEKNYECLVMMDLRTGMKVILGTCAFEEMKPAGKAWSIKDCAELVIVGSPDPRTGTATARLVPLGDLEDLVNIPHAVFKLSKKNELYREYVKFRSGLVIPVSNHG